ncbi:MAG: YicC family protein [Verrucomicrobia bacterium]|nr:YicC family protein [Verrucomicrobiota bacterium]
MTGYGRGECARDGSKITVEVSSVNRKQSEISVNLPRDLEPLEAQIRDEVNRLISRGRLTVRVALHAGKGKAASHAQLNTALAKLYAKEFAKLAKELKLTNGASLDSILRAPGVLEAEEDLGDAEDFWPAVKTALDKALAALVKMREREGAHLAKDLRARMKTISEAVARVQAQSPLVQQRYRENLIERVKNAGVEIPGADDERLLKEVIFFADRSDISEELTRLQSHFQQFDDCMKSAEPVGRTLDFLSQEMNREINTIGSKANDALISRDVVTVKAELEKFREQVQNVE